MDSKTARFLAELFDADGYAHCSRVGNGHRNGPTLCWRLTAQITCASEADADYVRELVGYGSISPTKDSKTKYEISWSCAKARDFLDIVFEFLDTKRSKVEDALRLDCIHVNAKGQAA